jgi:tripartite-type tricarboxylate transporter receptor subunit TctC
VKLSCRSFTKFARAAVAAPVFLAGLAIYSAIAQSADSPSFQGKVLTILFGGTGGGSDIQAHLVGRFISQHITGRPTVVEAGMPGAGGVILARHLFNIASKDGGTLGVVSPGALMQPLLNAEKDTQYDASKFNYLGSPTSAIPVCIASKSVPTAPLQDMFQQQLITGVREPGSPGADFTYMAVALAGAKFRLVRGYAGGFQAVALALERGEVEVICAPWYVVKMRFPDILKGSTDFRVFVRGDSSTDSELAKAGIPSLASVMANDLDRQALEFAMDQFVIATPFVLPPNVATQTVQMLRRAFADTISDTDFLAQAKEENVDISFTDGESVQGMITRLYQTPPAVVDRVKKALAVTQ